MMPLLGKWRRFLPYVGGIAALLLFAAALVILHKHAQAYRPNEVRRALRTLQAWQPFAALGLTAASYLLLSLYDVLALRHIRRTLPYGRVALASFTAYAFSHALGFASIIGPSIRYRVYTPMGLTAGEVAETSGFVIVTFTIGLVAVFPLIALLDPSSLETLGMSQLGGIWIGMLGLVLVAGYIGLGWWMDRPIVDQSCPWWPRRIRCGCFGRPLYPPADQILAGLLAFRVVYHLVPLVSAGALFGAVEVLAARRRFAQTLENLSIWVSAIGPTVVAGCAFMGGVMLLFSNAMPVSNARLRVVETVLPLSVIETSHLIGSIAGVLLLLLAYGLQERLRWAWAISALVLCVGAVSLILKGLAWEEAIALGLLLLALLPARREYRVSSPSLRQEYAVGWLVAIGVVLATAFWLGLFSYKQLDDAEWWRFTLYDNASRFLRASVAVAVVALGAAAYRLRSAVSGRRSAIAT